MLIILFTIIFDVHFVIRPHRCLGQSVSTALEVLLAQKPQIPEQHSPKVRGIGDVRSVLHLVKHTAGQFIPPSAINEPTGFNLQREDKKYQHTHGFFREAVAHVSQQAHHACGRAQQVIMFAVHAQPHDGARKDCTREDD